MPAVNKLCLLLVFSFFIFNAGCATYSATHNMGNPWQVGKKQILETNLLTFTYTAQAGPEQLSSIKGAAQVRAGELPAWAVYYEEASIMVYVTDYRGRILEEHRLEVAPGLVSSSLPFEFEINSPVRIDDNNYYISFGYFFVFAETDPILGTGGRKIIRQEGSYK